MEDPKPDAAEQADEPETEEQPDQTGPEETKPTGTVQVIESVPAAVQDPKQESTDVPHSHSWEAATCTEAETCADCGETRGDALGHSWKPATCLEAETCTVCGETRGAVLEHSWKAATYDAPKICTACGETIGESLPMSLLSCTKVEDSNPAGRTVDVNPGTWTDCFGNVYENAINFWTSNRANMVNKEHIVYQLGGNYKTLSGVIVAEKGSLSGSGAEIRIYFDDVLVYVSSYIERSTWPVEFNLDVTGVQQVRIESCCDTTADSYCIVQATVRK